MGTGEELRSNGDRLVAIDCTRGIGIILVVYAHALRGLWAAHLAPTGGALLVQDRLIYAFHMPLFFMLAGLFLERGVAKGRSGFVKDKLVTVAYPYLLWSAIHVVLTALLADHVNHPSDAGDLGRLLWKPVAQFWFLHVLLIGQLLAAATLPRLWLYGVITLGGMAASMAGLVEHEALGSLPFIFYGALLGRHLRLLSRASRTTRMELAALLWFGFLAAITLHEIAPALRFHLAAVLGAGATLLTGQLVADRLGLLAQLGQASMAIFVMHTIICAGFRIIVLQIAPGTSYLVPLIGGTLLGLIVPWAVWRWAIRSRWSLILGIGRPLDDGRTARAARATRMEPAETAA